MALTLQRKLELAGALSKLQPQLRRLHIVEQPKPKKRHLPRTVILVGSAIAAGAVVAGVVCRRRGGCHRAVAASGGDAQASSPEQDTPDAAPDWGRQATNPEGSQTIGAPRPA